MYSHFSLLTATGPQNMRCAIKLDSDFSAVACLEREKDVVRLRAYHAVVYAQPAHLPYLGGGGYTHNIAQNVHYVIAVLQLAQSFSIYEEAVTFHAFLALPLTLPLTSLSLSLFPSQHRACLLLFCCTSSHCSSGREEGQDLR